MSATVKTLVVGIGGIGGAAIGGGTSGGGGGGGQFQYDANHTVTSQTYTITINTKDTSGNIKVLQNYANFKN